MKKFITLFVVVAMFAFAACGEKVKEMKDAADNLQKIAEAGKNIGEKEKVAEAKLAERKKRGDTVAMPFKDLQKFLPTSIAGYTAQEPRGESVTMPEASISHSEIDFDNNGTNLKIELWDYNHAEQALNALTFWSAGISVENQDGFQRTMKTGMDNVFAYETFEKASKRASIFYAISYRFLLQVSAENQDNTEFVKKVANMINIKDLSNK
ncbi:MAG: hypothetical protein NT007_08805 [Candidatus Kapabacteria bacterium]|nr:hypothetical protein [Candidatus Kapabacteria bacterium]